MTILPLNLSGEYSVHLLFNATREGLMGGLPLTDSEEVSLTSPTLSAAIKEARRLVARKLASGSPQILVCATFLAEIDGKTEVLAISPSLV